MYNTVSQRYRAAFAILRQKPVLLWGLTLLAQVIAFLVCGLGWAAPIVSVPISLALSASLSVLHLKAVRGEAYETNDIFAAFKDLSTAMRVIGGMLWMSLWLFIWGLIPLVGPIIAIIKTYEYAFTPYILITRPDLGALDALKESQRLTVGLKGRMFCAGIIPAVILAAAMIVFGVFALIPVIGGIFLLFILIEWLIIAFVLPLFLGLVNAGFYEGAINPPPPPPQYQYPPKYGQPYPNQQYGQPYPNQQYYQPNPQQAQYYQPYPGQQVPPPPPQAAPQPVAPEAPVQPAAPAEPEAPVQPEPTADAPQE